MFTKTRLPHYYFGDDNVNQDDKLDRNNDSIYSIVEDVCASEPNLSRIPSPASSLASTKKLEWDSGADIGYSNAYNSFKKSRRSKSFPSLNMDLSISQINKSEEGQGDEMSIENKVAHDVNKEISSTNYQYTSVSKLPERNKKSNFQHSTPYSSKMVSKNSISSLKNSLKTCQTESANKNKDECLQTTLVKNCSRSVQTDSILLNYDQKVNKSLQTDTIKSHSSSSGNSLSKSSSFQYISCANTERLSAVESTTLTQKVESKESSRKSSRSSKTGSKSESSNSSKPSTVESISLSTSPLAKIIATQQSTHLITDIDKSLTILQNFIQSKNYTPDTKKFYARKIVNKIITSKYSDDSSSTSLSTNKSNEEPIEPNILLKIANSKDVNDSGSEKTITSQKNSRQVQGGPVQKNVGTETSDKNKELIKKLEEMISKNEKMTEKSKDKNKSEIDLSNKNWKEAETLSEKLFEARRKSIPSSEGSMKTAAGAKDIDKSKKGDYIVQHSKKERKRQLSWINNEISYLHRLKELLQKHDITPNSSPDIEIKNVSHSQNHSEKSNSTVTNKSTFSDVENRFYQEFGSCSSKRSENKETFKKLSSLLTNDQIKYLIANDAKKEDLSCGDCISKKICDTKTSKTEYKTYDSPSQVSKAELKTFICPSQASKSGIKTYDCPSQSQASKSDCLSHEEKNNSFHSHCYKLYDNVINSNVSQPIYPTEQQTKIFSLTSDAGIQCTLNKKNRPSPVPTDDSTRSTDYSYDRNDVKVFYKNTSRFNQSDSQSNEYGDSMPSYIHYKQLHSQNKGKENYYRQRKLSKNRPRYAKPVAYFLTFEEEHMSDFYPKRNSTLENVTVKIPKLLKSVPKPKPNPPVFRNPKILSYTVATAPKTTDTNVEWDPSVFRKPKAPTKKQTVPAEEQNKNECNKNNTRKPIDTMTYTVTSNNSSEHKTTDTNVESDPPVFRKPKAPTKPKPVPTKEQNKNECNKNNSRKSIETVTYRVSKSATTAHKTTNTNIESDQKTLQDYLLTNRPDYVRIADWRRSIILDQIDQNRRSRSIFTCAEMIKRTNDKFNTLPEVQHKKHMIQVINQRRQHRCMAHVFSKKLQKKTLKGELSIATCITVMSADSS